MIKLFRNIILITVVLALIVFLGVNWLVSGYGKAQLEASLSQSLEKPVNIEKLSYQFPRGLSAYGVTVGDFFKSKFVTARLDKDSVVPLIVQAVKRQPAEFVIDEITFNLAELIYNSKNAGGKDFSIKTRDQ